MLHQLPTNDVHRITSGQVIIDLKSCVKEIIENSIDAHSTKIDITIKNYGIDSIEIADDGDGIDKSDYDKICLNHYTSKITKFQDISENLTTFGFRGELMSSICSVSDVTISTKRESETVSTNLKYDHLGALVSLVRGPAKNKGTTVVVENLFLNLPVRQKNFVKNSKKEFIKLIQLVQQYCVIGSNLRIMCYHIVGGNKKKLMVSSNGNADMISRISQVYNNSKQFVTSLSELKLHVEQYDAKVEGYISNCSFGQGRSSSDRQMVFINSRPVSFPKLNKTINEVYKSFNHLEMPSFFLNLLLDSSMIDLNVTPDKFTVFLSNENDILELIKLELLEFFGGQDHVIPKNRTSDIGEMSFEKQIEETELEVDSKLPSEPISEAVALSDDSETVVPSPATAPTSVGEQLRQSIKRRAEDQNQQQDIFMKIGGRSFVETFSSRRIRQSSDEEEDNDENDLVGDSNAGSDPASDVESDSSELTSDFDDASKNTKKTTFFSSNLHHKNIRLDVDLSSITVPTGITKSDSKAELKELNEDVDDKHLGKISFNKQQFLDMKVVGQFNLGFIITTLKTKSDNGEEISNLFIIDQHASDEKYNFERLCNETVLQNQKLIQPLDLNLNSMDELVVLDNLPIFKQNGFDLSTDNNSLRLISIPISKKTVFNVQDFEELIHLLRDQTYHHNKIPRPSKIYKMFLSRACRSSTMIGDHLTHSKMCKIVLNLSTMEKPWNCPHGRPTMRHLLELSSTTTSFIKDYKL